MNRNRPWLAAPRDYIEHGTPVFVAAPAETGEFKYPGGWQSLVPNVARLDPWQPGWAACAVTGVTFDVIDVDPRHGGHESLNGLYEAGLVPPIYGEVATPSGGRHLYVARSGLRKCTPAPGIDLQAGDNTGKGRGFVFMTPTIRASKVDGQPKVYELVVPIDWDGLRECAGHQPWLDFVERSRRPEPPEPPAWAEFAGLGLEDFTEEDIASSEIRSKAYFASAASDILREMAEAKPGERNRTLNNCAIRLASIAAGLGVPWAEVIAQLGRIAIKKGLPRYEVAKTIQSGVRAGLKSPRSIT